MRRLGRKLLNIALKMILVAIPAVVSAILAYQAARIEDAAINKRNSESMTEMSKLLENHGKSIAELRGEVKVLKQLVYIRIGMGLTPFPPDRCDAPTPEDYQDLLPSPTPLPQEKEEKVKKMKEKLVGSDR